jgi:antibiotic biosynthesis monooxygenase (ABM) superfamily enzyme
MNNIRIFSQKILFNKYNSKKFLNYSNQLTETAQNYPGFISSKSYYIDIIDDFKIKDNIKIITISKWNNKDSWNKWINSCERKNISKNYENLDKKENFYILYDRIDKDIFLL